MAGERLTHLRNESLPSAPITVLLPDMETPSPFHEAETDERFKLGAMARIAYSAIDFVMEYSEQVKGKLDFSLESLSEVDKIIEGLESESEVENFVRKCGSYVGMTLFKILPGGVGRLWHFSNPSSFQFSAIRFRHSGQVYETNPFAHATDRVYDVLDNTPKSRREISVAEYIEQVLRTASLSR